MNQNHAPAGEKVERILTAAYELLAERGSAQVSIRDIARRAGVTLSLLPYYFGTREQLLLELLRRQTARHLGDLAVELGPAATTEERIERAVAFFQRRVQEDPGWFRLFIDLYTQGLYTPALGAEVQRLYRELFAVARAEVDRSAPESSLSAARARVVVAILDGLTLQALSEGPDAANELDQAFQVAAGALRQVLAGNSGPGDSGGSRDNGGTGGTGRTGGP